MGNVIKITISWLIALWASNVFLGSLFYKFDDAALEPQHIFTPLGWHPTWQVANEATCQAVFIAPNSCTDTSLANIALSILVLGIVMMWLNKEHN